MFTLALVVVLASCLPAPTGRLWRTTLSSAGQEALPVTLRDETGLVTGIEPAPMDAADAPGLPAVQADPSDPLAFLVIWLGGCDTDAQLGFQPSHQASGQYELHVSMGSPGGLGGGCAPVAVGRGLRIHTTTPIPIGSIAVNRAGP